MGENVLSLDPIKTFVPWYVVDGVHNDEIQDAVSFGLLQYVCQNYKGPHKAATCNRNWPPLPTHDQVDSEGNVI